YPSCAPGGAKPRRLLYAGQGPGQSPGMRGSRWSRAKTWGMAALLLGAVPVTGCTGKAAPGNIADQFVDAFFRRMDQQAARQFTALGATEMLDRELELTRAVRGEGYTQEEASGQVSCRRTGRGSRGERVRFDYAIEIRQGDSEEHRTADV